MVPLCCLSKCSYFSLYTYVLSPSLCDCIRNMHLMYTILMGLRFKVVCKIVVFINWQIKADRQEADTRENKPSVSCVCVCVCLCVCMCFCMCV